MQIHLSKPGGQREGPYSLEQINDHLAGGRYSGSDYWAWHEGLPEWMPLYSIPGVMEPSPDTVAKRFPDTEGIPRSAVEEEAPPADGTAPAAVEPAAAEPAEAGFDAAKLASGMPFAALDQIFTIASGEGPTASRSPVTAKMLEQIVGETLPVIRAQVPRDVIGHCAMLEGLKGQSSTMGEVWRAMARLKPDLLQQARDGLYRIVIRTFRIDNGDLVSVFLFYNKLKLEA